MSESFDEKLVVAISSRALFDLTDSHEVFENEGLEAYQRYQIEKEDVILEPGEAFILVKKLLSLNEKLDGEQNVEVILLSRNSSDTGLRVFNSIQHYDLNITRAAFSGGASPYRYVSAFGAHLFLSTNAGDVKSALSEGFAAATIMSSNKSADETEELRIAFDADAVIFSDESEKIFKSRGLEEFSKVEKASAKLPMSGGPFKSFLLALQNLQQKFDAEISPIRTAVITARSAPAHERVIRTLRAWNIRIDESVFLGGLDKGEFLKAFKADVFFDDQKRNCDSAAQHVATGHVPHGIANTNT